MSRPLLLTAKSKLGRRFLRAGAVLDFRIEIDRLQEHEFRSTVSWRNAPNDPKPRRKHKAGLWDSYHGAMQSAMAFIRDATCWISDARQGNFTIEVNVQKRDMRSKHKTVEADNEA